MNEELLISCCEIVTSFSVIHEFASYKDMHLNGKECLMTDIYLLYVKNTYTAFKFTSK